MEFKPYTVWDSGKSKIAGQAFIPIKMTRLISRVIFICLINITIVGARLETLSFPEIISCSTILLSILERGRIDTQAL